MDCNLIGYSGHSYVAIDIAHSMGLKISGYYDQHAKESNPFNIPYLGSEKENDINGNCFVAIGDNKIRRKVFENEKNNQKSSFLNLIHTSANVGSNVELGENIFIGPKCIINSQSKIGNGAIINSGAIIEHECQIGKFAHICPGTVLAGNVIIGENAFIGANSTVIQGVKIGANAIIGAGSVVIKDIPENTTFVGSPAKEIRKNK